MMSDYPLPIRGSDWVVHQPNRMDDDYEWALHDPDVVRVYAGQVVAVYNKQILGAGKTHVEALQAAQQRQECPGSREDPIVTVPIEGPTQE